MTDVVLVVHTLHTPSSSYATMHKHYATQSVQKLQKLLSYCAPFTVDLLQQHVLVSIQSAYISVYCKKRAGR